MDTEALAPPVQLHHPNLTGLRPSAMWYHDPADAPNLPYCADCQNEFYPPDLPDEPSPSEESAPSQLYCSDCLRAATPRRVSLPRPGSPIAARLANAVRAVVMREAHSRARCAVALARHEGRPLAYGGALAEGLRFAYARPRRASLSVLRAQAEAWAAHVASTGSRLDVGRKASDALSFSAQANLAALAVPSKLSGVASCQCACETLRERIEDRGGWIPAQVTDGDVHALGLYVGQVQPKHARWLAALPGVRVAVSAVTGGHPFIDASGEPRRAYYGVNVAFEVGTALDVQPAPRETAAQMQERLESLF